MLPVLLICLAVPAVGACLYLLVLTVLSAALPVPAPSAGRLRFDVIVPAHDEEAVIGHVIGSLQRLAWPADQFRILVVADNCTDQTAQRAAAAGAQVLERTDAERRGKGYALNFAFAASAAARWADAVVVVDADAQVSANLLEAFARRLERGAQAVQAHYGVSNPAASWRTRLLSIAKAAFHVVRSRARERLQLSCGIRGNGWAVTHALLARVPYRAYSLTEDLEYGIELGLAGVRVAYADEAHADAQMVAGEKDSRRQRQRWERGRFELMRSRTPALLGAALRQPSLLCLDLALDLLVLPLAYVALNVAALALLAALASAAQPGLSGWLWVAAGCAAALSVHVLRGWRLSGTGVQGLLDLGRAPFFLLWKLAVMLGGRRSREWVRTNRDGR